MFSKIKYYYDFNKRYGKVSFSKKINQAINLFSMLICGIAFLTILLFLLGVTKVYSVSRWDFLFFLIGALLVFLGFTTFTEISSIKYLRSLISSDEESIIETWEMNDDTIDKNQFIEEFKQINVYQYGLFLYLKSAIIFLICLTIIYLILRKLF